jgi:hypothetical protein
MHPMLLLWPGQCCLRQLASVMLYGCFYGLDYVVILCVAYAYFYDTSLGCYTWYLVPCNERSLSWDNRCNCDL